MAGDQAVIWQEGPWEHRFVPSNGSRFHVVLAGPTDAPLVVLLHGFPQFWWAWRHQIPVLADAGYRVAAIDIRGFGGSDKPPVGHTTPILTADVGGVIRSLGSGSAVVVGHDFGGLLAWSMPVLQPDVTRGVAVLGAPHPVSLMRLRNGLSPRTRAFLAWTQVPRFPERALRERDLVSRVLHAASAPGRALPPDEIDAYRAAMALPSVAHTSLEHLRWLVRAVPRPEGRRYLARMARPITVPVLSVRGGRDRLAGAGCFAHDALYVHGSLGSAVIPAAGHLLPEEAPDDVADLLIDFLATFD